MMRVSVVIPCYNVADYVADAVASALAQTYADLEVICIDDGSTDDTLDVLRALEREGASRLRVLTGANRGASAARNRGLGEATGVYVQFLDADDLLHPAKIAHQVGLVTAAPAPPAFVAGSWVRRLPTDKEVPIGVDTTDPWVALLKTRLGNTVSNLWNTAAVKAAGGWDEGRESSQEADLMFRMLQRDDTAVVYDERALTTVRVRRGSISTSNRHSNWKRYIQLRLFMLKYLQRAKKLTEARESAAYQSIFSAIRSLYRLDAREACQLHAAILPRHFRPQPSSSNTRTYVWFYKVLGFRLAEVMRAFIKKG